MDSDRAAGSFQEDKESKIKIDQDELSKKYDLS
jgi:hypothetical protein